MATAKFTIPQLIAMTPTLGYVPGFGTAINKLLSSRDEIEYKTALKDATEIALGYKVTTLDSMKDYGKNPNAYFDGVPLFQPLKILATDSNEEDLLLDSAVVSWNLPRNIVKTVIQGRDTSVKEFINNGDYVINVSGLMCSRAWRYPLEQVVTFDRFMKKKQSLKIEHEVLNALGVYNIVIDSYDCLKSPSINCQEYSFTAESDEPLVLKSKVMTSFFNT